MNLMLRDAKWKKVKLGELLSVASGKGIKVNSLTEGSYPVYGGNGINGYHKEYFLEEPALIIGRVGVKCGVTHITKPRSWVTDNALIVRPKVLDFDLNFFKLKLDFENLNKLSVSTAQPVISGSKIYAYEIEYPPLEEQQSIVSKIEELFSELDKSIETLRLAQQQLKTYRQAVLKWAFEGKLTEEWRKENGSSVRIQFGSQKSYVSSSGIEPELLAAEPIADYEVANSNGELPDGWKWVNFGKLFSESPQNGLYKSATEYGSGTPILRIDGFYDGKILDDYEYKRVKLTNEEVRRYLVSIGDILVNRVNSMPYLGKCGIVKYLKEDTVFESNIMKIRVCAEEVLPEYITMYLSSKKGLSELRKNAKQAVNQASINQTDVSNVTTPLPNIIEQKEIIKTIEERFSVADKMEESITQSLQQAEALRQSILKKAFEGKL